MNKSKKLINIAVIVIQCLFLSMLLVKYFNLSELEQEAFLLGNWGVFSIAFIVWVITSWYLVTDKIISYYNVFFVVVVLFHFGQAWADFIAPNAAEYVDLKQFYSEGKINAGYLFSFCCIVSFHTFALLTAVIRKLMIDTKINKSKELVHAENIGKDGEIGYSVKSEIPVYLVSFGILLFLFSFLSQLVMDVQLYRLVISGGYLNIYENPLEGTTWMLIARIAGFYYPATYILLYCFRKKPKWFETVFYVAVVHSLAYGFLIGNRGSVFMFIVAMFLYRHIVYKPFKKKDVALIAIFSLVILSLSSIIALTRIDSKNAMSIVDISNKVKGYNLVVSSISEFGGSLMTLLVAKRLIPSYYPHGMGISYLASSLVLIPDFLGLFDSIMPYISVSGLLTQFHDGLGGSLIAEAYFNFGNYSFVFMGVLGIAIGWYCMQMDKLVDNHTKNPAIIWSALMYLALLMYIRDQFYSVTSGLLQYFIYPWILYQIYRMILSIKKV